MNLEDGEVTDLLVERSRYRIHLFDKHRLRVETGDSPDQFLELADVKKAVRQADEARFTDLLELDRRVIAKVLEKKDARYAALAKQLSQESSFVADAVNEVEDEKNVPFEPRHIQQYLDDIAEKAVVKLTMHVQEHGWPDEIDG